MAKQKLCIIFVLLLTCTLMADDNAFRIAKTTYFSLCILDTGLTQSMLQSGRFRETNSIAKLYINNAALTYGIDFIATITTDWLFDTIKKRSKTLAYIVVGLAIVVKAYVVQHNWRLMRR